MKGEPTLAVTGVGSGRARTALRQTASPRTTPKLAPLGLRQGRCYARGDVV